jgi:hypothetical protein
MTFQAATLFCDHASRFLHLTCHPSTGAADAIAAKRAFERDAALANVTIKKFRADNGIFNSAAWKQTCDVLQQHTDFCGVNAHHQNGIAERQIRTIVDRSRTMLLHAIHKWPDVIHVDLWPFALKLAVDLHNSTPGHTGLSPAEIFTGVKDRSRLKDFHTFGCPVFVLEARLQAGHKIPKWEPRSRMAIYLGRSPHHATNVPLVMNIATGLVSPQFHVVYDDHFSTTQSFETNTLPPNWIHLFQERSDNVLADNPILRDAHTLGPEWDDPVPLPESTLDSPISSVLESAIPPSSEGAHHDTLRPSSEGDAHGSSIILTSEGGSDAGLTTTEFATVPSVVARPGWNTTHHHNTRFRRKLLAANYVYDNTNTQSTPTHPAMAFVAEQMAIHSDHSGSPTEVNPFSYLAADSSDVLHWGQMIKDPDRSKFEANMQDEIDGLFKHDTLQIVPSSSMPPNTKPLSAIWSFRKKRLPCWTIVKWKSRLCPHGGQQIFGVNFWHTYAPVVKWSTVRLILVLTSILDYKSRQVDFVQAFSQADIDCDVYMKIPAGFEVVGDRLQFNSTFTPKTTPQHHVLKLKRNLYGLRQAGYNWHEKLKEGLLKRGFRQSLVDPCLFLRHDCILVVYVDDCLLFSKTDSVLDDLTTSLQQEFILTVDGDVGAFLGIDIKRHSNGTLEMVQPGLIRKIVADCGLEDGSHTHNTPSETKILQRDANGLPREHSWNYRSIVGMLTYLSVTLAQILPILFINVPDLVQILGVLMN